MPFTPAHPAAILPLPRLLGKWSVPSALVIGSMTPDFAYFLRLNLPRAESHSLTGLLWVCLPAGWIAYLTFHLLLKRPLHSLTPGWLALRLTRALGPAFLPRTSPLAVTLSLLLGALTHLLWDSFTHNGAFVQAIPFLQIKVFSIGAYPFYAYTLLQHFSSAAGLILLGLWLYRWYETAPIDRTPVPSLRASQRLIAIAALLTLPALCGLATALPRLTFPLTMRTIEIAVGHAVVSVFSAFGLIVIAFATWWHLSPSCTK
jgi:hypothetical protein